MSHHRPGGDGGARHPGARAGSLPRTSAAPPGILMPQVHPQGGHSGTSFQQQQYFLDAASNNSLPGPHYPSAASSYPTSYSAAARMTGTTARFPTTDHSHGDPYAAANRPMNHGQHQQQSIAGSASFPSSWSGAPPFSTTRNTAPSSGAAINSPADLIIERQWRAQQEEQQHARRLREMVAAQEEQRRRMSLSKPSHSSNNKVMQGPPMGGYGAPSHPSAYTHPAGSGGQQPLRNSMEESDVYMQQYQQHGALPPTMGQQQQQESVPVPGAPWIMPQFNPYMTDTSDAPPLPHPASMNPDALMMASALRAHEAFVGGERAPVSITGRRYYRKASTFPMKLMKCLADKTHEDAVAWLPDGKSFIVIDEDLFCQQVLATNFKSSKYASFVRRLNRWGFVRLASGTGTDCFHHPLFRRECPDLCINMATGTGSECFHHQLFPREYPDLRINKASVQQGGVAAARPSDPNAKKEGRRPMRKKRRQQFPSSAYAGNYDLPSLAGVEKFFKKQKTMVLHDRSMAGGGEHKEAQSSPAKEEAVKAAGEPTVESPPEKGSA